MLAPATDSTAKATLIKYLRQRTIAFRQAEQAVSTG